MHADILESRTLADLPPGVLETVVVQRIALERVQDPWTPGAPVRLELLQERDDLLADRHRLAPRF